MTLTYWTSSIVMYALVTAAFCVSISRVVPTKIALLLLLAAFLVAAWRRVGASEDRRTRLGAGAGNLDGDSGCGDGDGGGDGGSGDGDGGGSDCS